jgi:hypothetical protein
LKSRSDELGFKFPIANYTITQSEILDAKGNHQYAVHGVQRAELFDHQEPEDDAGPAGAGQVLPALPQAHPAQRGEMIG